MVEGCAACNVFLSFISPAKSDMMRLSSYTMKALIVVILVAIAGFLSYRIFFNSKPADRPAPVTRSETEVAPEKPAIGETKIPVATNPVKTAVVKEVKPKPAVATRPQSTG